MYSWTNQGFLIIHRKKDFSDDGYLPTVEGTIDMISEFQEGLLMPQLIIIEPTTSIMLFINIILLMKLANYSIIIHCMLSFRSIL